jgi:hypothetical protein
MALFLMEASISANTTSKHSRRYALGDAVTGLETARARA